MHLTRGLFTAVLRRAPFPSSFRASWCVFSCKVVPLRSRATWCCNAEVNAPSASRKGCLLDDRTNFRVEGGIASIWLRLLLDRSRKSKELASLDRQLVSILPLILEGGNGSKLGSPPWSPQFTAMMLPKCPHHAKGNTKSWTGALRGHPDTWRVKWSKLWLLCRE